MGECTHPALYVAPRGHSVALKGMSDLVPIEKSPSAHTNRKRVRQHIIAVHTHNKICQILHLEFYFGTSPDSQCLAMKILLDSSVRSYLVPSPIIHTRTLFSERMMKEEIALSTIRRLPPQTS